MTPAFDGRAWYTKDPVKKTLAIHGTQKGEVSYRMTANRHDWRSWSNLYSGESTGVVVNLKK